MFLAHSHMCRFAFPSILVVYEAVFQFSAGDECLHTAYLILSNCITYTVLVGLYWCTYAGSTGIINGYTFYWNSIQFQRSGWKWCIIILDCVSLCTCTCKVITAEVTVKFVFAVLPGAIGLIGGRDRLYCSHTDVVRTFLSPPTAYTAISGNEWVMLQLLWAGEMCTFF